MSSSNRGGQCARSARHASRLHIYATLVTYTTSVPTKPRFNETQMINLTEKYPDQFGDMNSATIYYDLEDSLADVVEGEVSHFDYTNYQYCFDQSLHARSGLCIVVSVGQNI